MNADALGPDNKLIFSPGPFSGTNVPCASRMAVTAKSPLTGAVGMGLSGGHFPVELKFAGYDVLKNTDCRQRQTQTSQKNFHKSDEGQ